VYFMCVCESSCCTTYTHIWCYPEIALSRVPKTARSKVHIMNEEYVYLRHGNAGLLPLFFLLDQSQQVALSLLVRYLAIYYSLFQLSALLWPPAHSQNSFLPNSRASRGFFEAGYHHVFWPIGALTLPYHTSYLTIPRIFRWTSNME